MPRLTVDEARRVVAQLRDRFGGSSLFGQENHHFVDGNKRIALATEG